MDKKTGRLLFLYEFDKLSEADRHRFEKHLFECDYCFQSLHALSPVVTLMRQEKEVFASDLLPAPDGGGAEKRAKRYRLFPSPAGGWRWIFKPALGVAVLMVFALFIIRPWISGPQTFADLARIEPWPYYALHTRGQLDEDKADKLFEQGMELYNEKKYTAALVSLDSAKILDPADMGKQFYLGLTYLLADSVDSAIVYLNNVIQSGDVTYLDKSYWYLGNAYLLEEDGEKAIQQFEALRELDGERWKVDKMMGRIKKCKENQP
ncbi:zf-HC2 domain-containing protein [candidate division KSB1 bacterium]|nr:zf-HC2 domain-containing protein [candidate division KSB1 bacterium]